MACRSHDRTPKKASGASRRRGRVRCACPGVSGRRPQGHARGEQVGLPRVGAHGPAEQRTVVPAPQPVGAALLLVAPAGRQLGDRLDLVEHDGPVAHGRPDQPVAGAADGAEQGVEAGDVEDDPRGDGGRLDHRRVLASDRWSPPQSCGHRCLPSRSVPAGEAPGPSVGSVRGSGTRRTRAARPGTGTRTGTGPEHREHRVGTARPPRERRVGGPAPDVAPVRPADALAVVNGLFGDALAARDRRWPSP